MTASDVASDLDLTADSCPEMPMTRYLTTETGSIRVLDVDGRSLCLYPAGALEDGPANTWLRVLDHEVASVVSLFGQSSPLRSVTGHPNRRIGHFGTLRISVESRTSTEQAAWFTLVTVRNDGPDPVAIDLLQTQDPALADLGIARINEYYVSQYLDLTPIEVPDHGTALAVRQNMPGPTAPWTLVGGLGRVVGWATDARQLTGTGLPEGDPWPGLLVDLPSTRLQGEHTLAALQSERTVVDPGQQVRDGFYGVYRSHHPEASGPVDAAVAESVLAEAHVLTSANRTIEATDLDLTDHRSVFGTGRPWAARELTDAELVELTGEQREHAEYGDGRLLSYFTHAGAHVVTAAKQRGVTRPHGELLRSGTTLLPEETSVCTTVWMDGSFCSHLSQEHVGAGAILSPRRSFLGLQRAHGLRIFVRETGGDWRLLGSPSAWLIGLDHAQWWYADADRLIQVSTDVPAAADAVTVSVDVISGAPVEVLVAAHVTWGDPDALPSTVEVVDGGVCIRPPGTSRARELYDDPALTVSWSADQPPAVADDSALFRDGASRGQPWLTLRRLVTHSWAVTLTPELVSPEADRGLPRWPAVAHAVELTAPDTAAGAELDRLAAAIPWFAHDAAIHYLSPRGLEQFSGGAWGTRDVSQGPVGLLLASGAYAELRTMLIMVLAAQNPCGDWPQAFDFLPRHARAGGGGAHGDVVYWPLLAVAEYVSTTRDHSLLHEPGVNEKLTRALDHIESTLIDGTGLPAYGHGDWNDSLQPVDADLAARLCSTWTVVLQAHSLGTLADALAGSEPELADRARSIAEHGTADLRRLLLVDGVLSGYGLFGDDGAVEPLIHPRDHRTGLTYSVLPMIHAISGDLLTPEEARAHLEIIEEHLLGPDGVHLFDRPVGYAGGPMRLFQRAEASSFFGREIGLMYMHAHLRYAEALARVGDGAGLLRALGQAHPVGITERVPNAAPRQANCYYSSSDAAFADRYAARDDYARALSGEVPVEGGWRVYSSGPGLFLRLVTEQLLGVRVRGERVELDPVLDPGADGLEAQLPVAGTSVRLRYRVGDQGHGVRTVRVKEVEISAETLQNPYRCGGASVMLAELATGGLVEVETW